MLILHDPTTLLHSTVELISAKLITALESPARITSILAALANTRHQVDLINTPFDNPAQITHLLNLAAETHKPDYLTYLRTVFEKWRTLTELGENDSILPECFTSHAPNPNQLSPPKDLYAQTGYYAFDMSTGIMRDTYKSTIASAYLAHHATSLLFSEDRNPSASPAADPYTIVALTRPPGHHCDGARAGGYCYINNAAIAISTFRSLRSAQPSTENPHPRAAILDLDFHHGNGTQSIYYTDPTLLYISIHGADEFPYYTGFASETGSGPGEGFNLNFPLPRDTPFKEWEECLEKGLKVLRGYKPEFLVVSLGFDTFEGDVLGSFGVGTGDYERMARRVRGCLREMERDGGKEEKMKTVVLLEGGYVVEKLGGNLISFIKGWEEE